MCDRRQLRSSRQRRIWRSVRPLEFLARSTRHLCLHVASVRGLQRLQRHCSRQRPTARLPFHGQFPPALPRGSPPGFLAPLAHQSQYLASRLPLHPPRWQRRWQLEDFPKSLRYDGPCRPLAWRELDLRDLWRHPRARALCRALLLPGQIRRPRSPSSLHWFFLPLGAENFDLQYSWLEPGLLPRDLSPCSRSTARGIVQFRLAQRIRLRVLHALPLFYPSIRCGFVAGSERPGIPIRNLALCPSNRLRCRRTCRAGTFFGEQSQCFRLLPILSTPPSSTPNSWSASVPF